MNTWVWIGVGVGVAAALVGLLYGVAYLLSTAIYEARNASLLRAARRIHEKKRRQEELIDGTGSSRSGP